MKARGAYRLIHTRGSRAPAFLASPQRVDHIEIVEDASMEVVLFWDVPAPEAPRFIGALRNDLATLEAAGVPRALARRQLGRQPAVTDRELVRAAVVCHIAWLSRGAAIRHREPDVRWVVRKRDASLLFPRLAVGEIGRVIDDFVAAAARPRSIPRPAGRLLPAQPPSSPTSCWRAVSRPAGSRTGWRSRSCRRRASPTA